MLTLQDFINMQHLSYKPSGAGHKSRPPEATSDSLNLIHFIEEHTPDPSPGAVCFA